MNVVVLTDRRYVGDHPQSGPVEGYADNVMLEDNLVCEALKKRGVPATRHAWCDPEVDWSRVACAVFRTTWDYFDRWPAFSAWLESSASKTTLLNAPEVLRWNLDKHYLKDLQSEGIAVVPTTYVAKGTNMPLLNVMEQQKWTDVVVKPAIAGGAFDTYRVTRAGAVTHHSPIHPTHENSESLWRVLLTKQDMLVQPFLFDVIESGEISLIWIEGEVTHGVQKQAKKDDFRVQDDHGGTVTPIDPTPELVQTAQDIMAKCMQHCAKRGWDSPLYARVDLMRGDQGTWLVSELEMVEPELWFRFCPAAADRLANAIHGRLLAQGSATAGRT